MKEKENSRQIFDSCLVRGFLSLLESGTVSKENSKQQYILSF